MSLLARLLEPRAAEITTSRDLDLWLRQGGQETDSGVYVSPDSAMRVAAVYAAVRVLAETVAQIPLVVYRRNGEAKERARDHWLYRLLHDQPNGWQTSFEFREMMQAHLALSGNAYALKTVVRGEVRELLPVTPDRVTVIQDPDYRVRYEVRMPDGHPLPVPQERMLHLPGLAFNGLTGVSPVAYQREAIGFASQLTRHGARLFKNGAQIGGVLEHPGKLSAEANERLRKSFDEQYAGASNAHKTLLLEEGMKFSKTGMTAEDAQFLESRKYSRNEIATVFRIPPHMIGDLERATFTNIEHQGLEFVKYSMGPWFARWEQRILTSLVPPAERDTLFAEFKVDGLLRGDYATRTKGYKDAIETGWMSRNEVRALENLNPVDGLDEFLTPLNMDDPNRDAPNEPEEPTA